jgi:hypothetical protein
MQNERPHFLLLCSKKFKYLIAHFCTFFHLVPLFCTKMQPSHIYVFVCTKLHNSAHS